MKSETLMPGEAYMALLDELMRDLGVSGQGSTPKEEAALGLSFSIDGHTCSLLPHPAIEDRLILEVTVAPLSPNATSSDADDRLHEIINRLNAAARLEHDWVACVDDNETVILWAWRDVPAMTAASTQALLAEGLDRAQAFRKLLQTAQGQPSSDGTLNLTGHPSDEAATNTSGPAAAGWAGLRV